MKVHDKSDLDTAVSVSHDVLEANPRVLWRLTPIGQAIALGPFGIGLAIGQCIAVRDCAAATGEINPDRDRAHLPRAREGDCGSVTQALPAAAGRYSSVPYNWNSYAATAPLLPT